MMKKIPLLAIGLTILLQDVQARVGETKQECRKRYGSKVEISAQTDEKGKIQSDVELLTRNFGAKDIEIFEKSGMVIIIGFYHGKAELMFYRKFKMIGGVPPMTRVYLSISAGEREYLRKANGGDAKWIRIELTGLEDSEFFATEDGRMRAFYSPDLETLTILTSAQLKRAEEEHRKSEATQLQGL